MPGPKSVAICIIAFTLPGAPLTALAEASVLTGTFDGSERAVAHAPNPYDCADRPAGYQAVGFEVSQSGSYDLSDPYLDHYYGQGWNAGYTLEIYQGPYEPSAAQDAVPLTGGGFALQSGRSYSLVVHSKCAGFEGAWAAAFQGPGSVLSDKAAELPPFSRGELTPSSPTMPSDCGAGYYAWGWGPVEDAPYAEVGPLRLSRGGEYYYGSGNSTLACLAVYTAPVNPADRQANRLALLSGYDATVMLEADTDYWFVTHWKGWENSPQYGEYLHVLVPPATIRINAGLNGAWYNAATPGEGFFLSVFDSLNKVFLANFTFADQVVAGDPHGHRWYTAAGLFTGNSAELDVSLAAGGAFNATWPQPQLTRVGSLLLQFSDCSHGSIVVNTGPPDETQAGPVEIPLQRLGSDWEEICRSQYEGLDEVGPL